LKAEPDDHLLLDEFVHSVRVVGFDLIKQTGERRFELGLAR
jgi:hypothetical protein